MSKPSNPNGANQYNLDPRQLTCWEFYIDPQSKTFGNATQSALKAGYEYETADKITAADWFVARRRRLNMLSKAEKVLDETLDYIAISEEGKIDTGIGRLKLDAAKVIATTLGKDEGYSSKVVLETITDEDKQALLSLLDEQTSTN